MTTRENASHKKVVQHLSAAEYTASQSPNGVDTKGFESLTFLLSIGVITNIGNSPTPSWDFKAQESDSESSGFTDITDSERVVVTGAKSPVAEADASSGVFLTVDAAAEDDEVYHVGVISSKRYVRIVPTANDTPGATPLSIVAELERADLTPVTN